MKYHEMFRLEGDGTEPTIKKDAVLAIRKAIKLGLFRTEESQRKAILENLNFDLSKVYSVPPIEIIYHYGFLGMGAYLHGENKMILNKTSLVTFLHEFYHYLAIKTGLVNDEENARGFSISAYYLATPKLCTSSINRGLIVHQTSMEVA